MNLVHRPQGTVFQMPKYQAPFSVQNGDVITIAYDSLQRSTIPVDPVIIRKRDDLYWGGTNIKQTAPVSMLLIMLQCIVSMKYIPPLSGGYWNDIQNRRNFFIELAHQNNFEPLVADNWYNFTKSSLSAGIKVFLWCCIVPCLASKSYFFRNQDQLNHIMVMWEHCCTFFQTLDWIQWSCIPVGQIFALRILTFWPHIQVYLHNVIVDM